jgi:hypothetical protein
MQRVDLVGDRGELRAQRHPALERLDELEARPRCPAAATRPRASPRSAAPARPMRLDTVTSRCDACSRSRATSGGDGAGHGRRCLASS